jgi:UDP:flavonoid glycosyltransferase YjiC (YdhE family)
VPTALLATADMGGNIPPELAIAGELQRRGWRVVVHGEDRLRERVEAAGLPFALAEGYPYDPVRPTSTARALRTMTRFLADRSRGRSAVAVAEREAADVVLVDALLLGVLAQVQEAGLRSVVVVHTSWDYFARTYGPGPVAALMRLRGVSAMRAFAGADRVLVASDERFGSEKALPANTVRTGAVLQEVPAEPRREDPPLVLVSLSTVFFPGMTEALQRVLDALAPLPVRVEVTAGRAVRVDDLRVPANATLHGFVDHAELLPRADLVIGHGGHATTVRALAHGVPLLVLPMHPMLDQPMIGRAVAEAGAGLRLPKSAKPETIRAAVRRLLAEPAFRSAAESVGAHLRSTDGAAAAADVVAELAGRTDAAGQSRPVRLQASSEDSSPASS